MKTRYALFPLLSLALLSACGAAEVEIEPGPSRAVLSRATETVTPLLTVPPLVTLTATIEAVVTPTSDSEVPATATPMPTSTLAAEASDQVPPTDLCRAYLDLSVLQGEAEGAAVATSYRCHSAFIDSTGRSPSSSPELVARLGTPIRLQLETEQWPTEIDVRLYPGAGLSATFMRWPEELPTQAKVVDRFQPEPDTAFEYLPQVPAGLYSLVVRVSWGEDIVVFYGLSLALEDASQ